MAKRRVAWFETTAPRKGTVSARVGACELMVTPSTHPKHENGYRWELRRFGSTERIGFNHDKAKAKGQVMRAAASCGGGLGYNRRRKKRRRR